MQISHSIPPSLHMVCREGGMLYIFHVLVLENDSFTITMMELVCLSQFIMCRLMLIANIKFDCLKMSFNC